MKSGRNIHGSQRTDRGDFGVSLTFPLVPTYGFQFYGNVSTITRWIYMTIGTLCHVAKSIHPTNFPPKPSQMFDLSCRKSPYSRH